MNWNEIELHWVHMTARLRRQWYRLTDADLKRIAGKRANLIDAIERRYGVTTESAEMQVRDWTARLSIRPPPSSQNGRSVAPPPPMSSAGGSPQANSVEGFRGPPPMNSSIVARDEASLEPADRSGVDG